MAIFPALFPFWPDAVGTSPDTSAVAPDAMRVYRHLLSASFASQIPDYKGS
jgi:hypothetical protein